MPVAGVIILTVPERADEVLLQLQQIEGVSTYGVHKENNIVAVFEGESPQIFKQITDQITDGIPGVLGVYPSTVYYDEDQISEADSPPA